MGSTQKSGIFLEYFLNKGGEGSGVPKLYVKFWWPWFLAVKTRLCWPKLTFLFVNVPRGWSTGLGIIPKKYQLMFECFPYMVMSQYHKPTQLPYEHGLAAKCPSRKMKTQFAI